MSKSSPSARLYVTQPLQADALITLEKAQAHYLATVLRQKQGAIIALFNGQDGEWWGEVTSLDRKSATIQLFKQARPQTNEPDIWLCFAPIKFGRIDFLVQKATELGVSALIPVKTARTIVSRINPERLEANIIEASEQSERITLPQLREYNDLEILLAEWPKDRLLLHADEAGTGAPAIECLQELRKEDGSLPPLGILIGPEGGFHDKERQLIASRTYTRAISLGPRVLRADTAALAALTATMLFHPDWSTGRPSFA